MRFFRAERGKTAYEQKSSTALPKAKKADRVSPVIELTELIDLIDLNP